MPTPLPEELFAAVAHDLSVCGLANRLVERAPYGGAPGSWRQLVVAGVRVGYLEFDTGLEPEALVEILAAHTQDAVLEHLQAVSGGVAWPLCRPGHAHPMRLVSAADADPDNGPRWECPAAPAHRWPVGGHPGPPTR